MKKKWNGSLDDNVEIVVAHYNEDLEWVKPYAKNAVIYHKGNEDSPRFPVKRWIKLKNVGREGETYLQHIINNYDKLANITIFLQGGIRDHLNDRLVYENFGDYIKESYKYGFSTRRLTLLFKKSPQIKREGKFLQAVKNGTLRKSEYSFASFYKKIFGREQPVMFPCFFAANFAVTKQRIRERPKNFYATIHEYFIDHSNPEEGHFLERLRFNIFNKKLNFHYFIKIIINPFISQILSFKNINKG